MTKAPAEGNADCLVNLSGPTVKRIGGHAAAIDRAPGAAERALAGKTRTCDAGQRLHDGRQAPSRFRSQ